MAELFARARHDSIDTPPGSMFSFILTVFEEKVATSRQYRRILTA
jgi:hypothetical protein